MKTFEIFWTEGSGLRRAEVSGAHDSIESVCNDIAVSARTNGFIIASSREAIAACAIIRIVEVDR